MKFYYTIKSGHDDKQTNPLASLGGFKSSIGVPNDEFSNIFPGISPKTIKDFSDGNYHYIALMLINETGGDTTNLRFHFDYGSDPVDSIYEIGVTTTVVDSDGNPTMEEVEKITQRPFSVENFYTADGVLNEVSLGDLNDGLALAIWLRRSIDKDSITQQYEDSIVSNPDGTCTQNELPKFDRINLVLNWD
jgi:hypothetical protein